MKVEVRLMKMKRTSVVPITRAARIHLRLWERALRPRQLKCEDAGREKVLVKHRARLTL